MAVGLLIFLEIQFRLVFVWNGSQGQLSCHSSWEEERRWRTGSSDFLLEARPSIEDLCPPGRAWPSVPS